MNKEKIARLKELAEMATPEEWEGRGHGDEYLREIRERAVKVYEGYDDRYIGANSVAREESYNGTIIKVRAINRRQRGAYSYFLYTFTPCNVIMLIDEVLHSRKRIEQLEKAVDALTKGLWQARGRRALEE